MPGPTGRPTQRPPRRAPLPWQRGPLPFCSGRRGGRNPAPSSRHQRPASVALPELLTRVILSGTATSHPKEVPTLRRRQAPRSPWSPRVEAGSDVGRITDTADGRRPTGNRGIGGGRSSADRRVAPRPLTPAPRSLGGWWLVGSLNLQPADQGSRGRDQGTRPPESHAPRWDSNLSALSRRPR